MPRVVLALVGFYLFKLRHVSQSYWLICRVDLFFEENAMSQLLIGSCRFVDPPLGPINMCILSLTPHFSDNFLSTILSKSLV